MKFLVLGFIFVKYFVFMNKLLDKETPLKSDEVKKNRNLIMDPNLVGNIANTMAYGMANMNNGYNSYYNQRPSSNIIEQFQRSGQIKQVRSILSELDDRLDDLSETIQHRLNEINGMIDRNSLMRQAGTVNNMGMGMPGF